MTPATLSDLLAADRLGPVRDAMRARLAALLPGVTVVAHPGRIDISEVVAKSVVATPGIALGWSRIRAARIVDGNWHMAVEWAAYVVVEDLALAEPAAGGEAPARRRVDRATLGLVIGARVLAILNAAEEQTWGQGWLLPPEAEPRPELRPMFTVRDVAQGAAYYVVTWTQAVVALGAGLFAPAAGAPEAEPPAGDAIDILADDTLPPEIVALLANLEAGHGGD